MAYNVFQCNVFFAYAGLFSSRGAGIAVISILAVFAGLLIELHSCDPLYYADQ